MSEKFPLSEAMQPVATGRIASLAPTYEPTRQWPAERRPNSSGAQLN